MTIDPKWQRNLQRSSYCNHQPSFYKPSPERKRYILAKTNKQLFLIIISNPSQKLVDLEREKWQQKVRKLQ